MKITRTSRGTFKLSLQPSKSIVPESTFIEDDNKYLFDQGYTVGFRKDGRLFKFVGLRNGYEKQLELTISSILIDHKQYVSSNDKYFDSLFEINKVITHNINDITLQNKISKDNFKNMVIVNEQFNKLEIIYEVHIKGLKINNLSKLSKYIQNNDGQFIIGDEYNNNEFIIESPVAYDSNGTELKILEHNLYYEDSKLYYRKNIKNNQIVNNYPLYIDINISFEPYSYGYQERNLQELGDDQIIWNSIVGTSLAGLTGLNNQRSNNESWMHIVHNIGLGNYELGTSRLYYTFNTSSILSTSTFNIINVNLISTSQIYNSGSYSYLSELTLQHSYHEDTLTSTNFDNNWNKLDTDPKNFQTIEFNEGSNISPLSEDMWNIIKTNDKFKFCVRGHLYDYLGSLPPTALSNSLTNVSLEVEFTIDVANPVSFTFPTNYWLNGTSYISKNAQQWSDTRSPDDDGFSDEAIVWNNESIFLVGALSSVTSFTVYRSFLSFDTSLLKYFNIYEAEINFKTLNNLSDLGLNPETQLYLVAGTQTDNIKLDYTDYISTGSTSISVVRPGTSFNYYANDPNIIDNINIDGNTKFVLMHHQDFIFNPLIDPTDTQPLRIKNSYDPSVDADLSNRITLNIFAIPIIVVGSSTYIVENIPDAILTASTNPENTIAWYEDISLTNPPNHIGEDYKIDKKWYNDGDILYAIAIDDNSGQTSLNVLNVALSMKKIYGQDLIIIDDSPGLFQLSATTNYPQYQIAWYTDSELTLASRIGVSEIILLKNEDYYEGDVIYVNAIDEYGTPVAISLEVLIHKIKVYGPSIIYYDKYTTFDLHLFSSSENQSYDYLIFKDEDLTELVGNYNLIPGEKIVNLKSTLFDDGDIIYTNLFTKFTGTYNPNVNLPLASITLKTSLYEIINNYSGITSRIDYRDATDIDSVYFKYHNCLNGVCYTYIRDLDNPYEETLAVNDVVNNGIYNMYSEFDIISEFYSNSHIAEIAYNTNVDLTKKYKEVENIEVFDGTRIILYGQTDLTENGVYELQSNNSLLKTEELDNDEDIFRYKASVLAGSNINEEIHITSIQVSDVFLPTQTFTTTTRYISSPITEGIPFKIGDWDSGTQHQVVRSTAVLSYDVNNQIVITNDITTFTVTVYDTNGTTELATNFILFNGDTSSTSENITITVTDWINVAEGYSCNVLISIAIANILTPGGRFNVYMSWNDNVFTNLEYAHEDLFRDDETLIATLAGTLTVNTGTTVVYKTISGIDFYTLNTQWQVHLNQINNINSRSYPLLQQLGITNNYFLITDDLSAHGNNDDFSGGTFTNYHDVTGVTYDKLDWTTDILDSHNWSHISGNTELTYATANVYDWDVVTPDDTIDSINYPYIIDTIVDTSDRKTEVFSTETGVYTRLQSDLNTEWDNSASLGVTDSNTGLQILAGRLVYPQIDFSMYNIDLGAQYDYSSLSGDRYYYRAFEPLNNQFISNGVIILSDYYVTEVDLSGNTVKFDISVDSGVSWYSLNSQYTGGRLEDGYGCRIDSDHYNISGSTNGGTINDNALSFTLGYVGSNNYVYLRIMISDTVLDRYIGGIQFSGSHWD